MPPPSRRAIDLCLAAAPAPVPTIPSPSSVAPADVRPVPTAQEFDVTTVPPAPFLSGSPRTSTNLRSTARCLLSNTLHSRPLPPVRRAIVPDGCVSRVGQAVSVATLPPPSPPPVTPKQNAYIFFFTDRFRGRASTYAVIAAEFTVDGVADDLTKHFATLWSCPATPFPDDWLKFYRSSLRRYTYVSRPAT